MNKHKKPTVKKNEVEKAEQENKLFDSIDFEEEILYQSYFNVYANEKQQDFEIVNIKQNCCKFCDLRKFHWN